MAVKVHRVVLLVVDHDNVGASRIDSVLESTRYPNRCIAPRVVRVETREIEWSDAHPLNSTNMLAVGRALDDVFAPERPEPTRVPGSGVPRGG